MPPSNFVPYSPFHTQNSLSKPTHLPISQNRHHNLTSRLAITRNMPRKCFHIRHKLRCRSRRRHAADSPAKGDDLAGDFAMKGGEDELVGVLGVEDVEACARRWLDGEGRARERGESHRPSLRRWRGPGGICKRTRGGRRCWRGCCGGCVVSLGG